MGLGELGIEGSSVVENTARSESAKKTESIQVTVAGIIFLLVNIFLGSVLIYGKSFSTILFPGLISLGLYGFMIFLFFKIFNPSPEKTRN